MNMDDYFKTSARFEALSNEALQTKYIELHREFNNKRVPKKVRMAGIPVAEALRAELARRGALLSVEDLALALCDPVGDDAA